MGAIGHQTFLTTLGYQSGVQKPYSDMAKGEIVALKEALCNQYIIMKKLYAELEEERDASATACSEALAMILRLQREKAAEKMEACQYKRVAEERIHHVEESLEILEEVIHQKQMEIESLQYQKQMEIESLQYQLHTYKHKLSGFSISTPDFGDMLLCANNSFREINAGSTKATFNGIIRRNVSFPSLRRDYFCGDMEFFDSQSSISPYGESVRKRIDDFTNLCIQNSEKEIPDLPEELVAKEAPTQWKCQTEEVNRRVKELIQAKNSVEVGSCSSVASNEVPRTSSPIGSISSWFSAVSSDASSGSTNRGIGMKSDDEYMLLRSKDSENASCLPTEVNGKAMYSDFAHDLFEVPESHKGCMPSEPCKKILQDSIMETKAAIEMPKWMPRQTADYLEECLCNSMSNHKVSNFPMPSKGAVIHHGRKITMLQKEIFDNYHWALKDPNKVRIANSQTDLEQIRRRLQQIENEKVIMQDSEREKEQLKLLREMLKLLNSIEMHIKGSPSRKSSPTDESSFVSFMEAVLSFSI